MNCRGKHRREEIVRDYYIHCTAYIRLLNGRVIRSDAERDITRKYYIFSCINKNDANIVEQICCGEGAGREFLQLANIVAPPIFNMLHEENNDKNHRENHGNSDGVIQKKVWNEAALQLYNAIMILITAWDLQPGPIFKYLKEAKQYSYCVPYANRVKKINDILHRNNTSIREVLNQLAENNNLREYHFNLLEDILHQENIVSYFEDAKGL